MNNLYNHIKLAVDDYNVLVNREHNASIIMDKDNYIFCTDFGIDCDHPIINSSVFTTLKTYTGETPPEQNTATVEEIARKAMGEQLERERAWREKQKELTEELERIASTEKAIQQSKTYELLHPLLVNPIELTETLDEKLARYETETRKDNQEQSKADNGIIKGIESAYKKYKDIYDHDGFEDK